MRGSGRVFPFTKFPELADTITCQREYTLPLNVKRASSFRGCSIETGYRLKIFVEPGNRPAKRQESPEESSMTLDAQPYGTLNGQACPVAMKLTGHLTESIYRRYAIVSEADLSEGVAKLSALHQRENEPSELWSQCLRERAKHGQSRSG